MIETTLRDKINMLSNDFLVTEEQLLEAYSLGVPNAIEENVFLSFHAVMADMTGVSAREIQNYLHHFMRNIDFTNGGLIITAYRMYHTYHNHTENGIKYLIDSLGHYNLSKTIILLGKINLIEEYSYKIN